MERQEQRDALAQLFRREFEVATEQQVAPAIAACQLPPQRKDHLLDSTLRFTNSLLVEAVIEYQVH